MKALLLLSSLLVLGGCSGGTQPRALMWGLGQPLCFAFCFAQATVTDAEGSSISASGAVSNTNTQSATATQSPTLKFGGGTPAADAVPVPAAP